MPITYYKVVFKQNKLTYFYRKQIAIKKQCGILIKPVVAVWTGYYTYNSLHC